jgi:hypothetical protein
MMSFTWKDESTLLYTQTKDRFAPHDIKALDLTTGKSSAYFSFEPSPSGQSPHGAGHYFINYDIELQTLFSLQSLDWSIAQINKVNDDNTITLLREVDELIWSFGLFEEQIIFKGLDNHLKSFAINDPEQLTTIYKNSLKAIRYPVVSANSNKIAIVSGSVFKNDIYALSLDSMIATEVLKSNTLLRYPQKVDDGLLFMSDETGISQIYSYQNKQKIQITNFNKNKKITYFATSPDKHWLAISFAHSTVVYERHDGGVTPIKTFDVASHPAFNQSSERILLTNLVGDNKEKMLVEYYLTGFIETGISIQHAPYGIYHHSGIIIPSNDNSIKIFKLKGIDTIATDIKVSNRSAIAVNDSAMFISSSMNNVVRIDLQTGDKQVIEHSIRGQISVSDNTLYYKTRQYGSMAVFKGELTRH